MKWLSAYGAVCSAFCILLLCSMQKDVYNSNMLHCCHMTLQFCIFDFFKWCPAIILEIYVVILHISSHFKGIITLGIEIKLIMLMLLLIHLSSHKKNST